MSRSIVPPSRDADVVMSAKALQRAAKRALELGLQTGTPVYVMKQGKIVDLTKEAGKHFVRGGKSEGKAG
jgi:hypothetical protein